MSLEDRPDRGRAPRTTLVDEGAETHERRGIGQQERPVDPREEPEPAARDSDAQPDEDQDGRAVARVDGRTSYVSTQCLRQS